MSRFKARLTSWSTHGACFPFLSLHCFVSTSSNERSSLLTSGFCIPLTFVVDKWKCHSKAAWRCGCRTENTPGWKTHQGLPAWHLPETQVSQPPAAEPDPPSAPLPAQAAFFAATPACWCFYLSPRNCPHPRKHPGGARCGHWNFRTSLPGLWFLKGGVSWEHVSLEWKMLEKSLIITSVTNTFYNWSTVSYSISVDSDRKCCHQGGVIYLHFKDAKIPLKKSPSLCSQDQIQVCGCYLILTCHPMSFRILINDFSEAINAFENLVKAVNVFKETHTNICTHSVFT